MEWRMAGWWLRFVSCRSLAKEAVRRGVVPCDAVLGSECEVGDSLRWGFCCLLTVCREQATRLPSSTHPPRTRLRAVGHGVPCCGVPNVIRNDAVRG
ncbi:hypothetical protein QBC39DRAFT_344874 [Podospora conica]|nr:hypothetical protein QBC39DRAFT_344874 [Schizothecium conicum]